MDALRRLKDRVQADDITQEIFVSLWLKRETLDINNVPAYLRASVRNRILNLFEKERRYVSFEQLLPEASQDDPADAGALSREFLQAYVKLVESLPSQRRKIFKYYYDQGLSTDEIAQRLSLSRKTVQNQLGTAVAYLRSSLSNLLFLAVILSVVSP